MATTKTRPPSKDAVAIAIEPLHDGERLDQPTFHARYEAMPEEFRAELIEGRVAIMPSPVTNYHARAHGHLAAWLGDFAALSDGVELRSDATLILNDGNELQPDVFLYHSADSGGSVHPSGEYLSGVPDLVIEVAVSSSARDLRHKKAEYERAGVPEYLVVLPAKPATYWFVLEAGRYVDLPPGDDGILRSRAFAGLWLDPQALLAGDLRRLKAVGQQGLSAREQPARAAGLEAPNPPA